MGRLELGIVLEKKMFEKSKLSKNVSNKNCSPILIFFEIKKRLEGFLTLKVDYESLIYALIYNLF